MSTLLTWVAFAILCFFVAKSKNRNPWEWAAWGLVGGIISLGILLVFKPALKQ